MCSASAAFLTLLNILLALEVRAGGAERVCWAAHSLGELIFSAILTITPYPRECKIQEGMYRYVSRYKLATLSFLPSPCRETASQRRWVLYGCL